MNGRRLQELHPLHAEQQLFAISLDENALRTHIDCLQVRPRFSYVLLVGSVQVTISGSPLHLYYHSYALAHCPSQSSDWQANCVRFAVLRIEAPEPNNKLTIIVENTPDEITWVMSGARCEAENKTTAKGEVEIQA